MHSDDHPRREDIRLVAVLRALADPVRLSVVRQVADDRPHACGSIATPLVPSAMTRHFRILRDPKGTSKLLTLRRDDLDARFPGLLDAVLRTPDGDGPAPGARSE
mgnify:CR=1 FL=1